MVIVDGISKKSSENKGFMSFLSRFAGSTKKAPTKTDEITSSGAGKDSHPAVMTLKLSTPPSPQSEEPPKLLSDILMNEQLFEVFHGKSLILQAEVKVEKQLDGSPKSMIVSGQVPVTLSKGFRNGKPTREIRVRGHLRRKLSSELTTNALDSRNNADRLGRKHPMDAEDKYRTDRKREHYGRRKTRKDPPLSPLEQAEFQNSSPFRTYSKLGLSTLEKKNDFSHWSAGEAGYIDQKLSSENNLQENPTGIANWSPYFDCGSPMSDRQFEASWDLREKTPTPRFSSPSGRGCHVDGEEKSSMEPKSSNKPARRGDWTPFIGMASSSADNPTITKTESFRNKNEEEDPRWNPQVNKCMLVGGDRSNVGEDKEEGNGRDPDHFGLCVARSESVVDALKESKLNTCCKEDTFSTDSIINYEMSDRHLHDDATQTTNERRRMEISKISQKVGQKITHLKEMVMRPKMNPENLINVNGAGKRDRNETDPSNIYRKQFESPTKQVLEGKDGHSDDEETFPVRFRSPRSTGDPSNSHRKQFDNPTKQALEGKDGHKDYEETSPVHFRSPRSAGDPSDSHRKRFDNPTKQALEGKDGHNDDDEALPVHFRSPRSSGDKSVRVMSTKQKNTDHYYASGSHGKDDFRDKIDQDMLDKLLQARESSIDRHTQITKADSEQNRVKSTDHCYACGSQDKDYFHDKIDQEMLDKLLQARASSIDRHSQITKANGEQNRVKSIDPANAEKVVHSSSKKPARLSKMVQARESSIDQYIHIARNKGDNTLQALGDKVKKVVHGISDESGKLFLNKDKIGKFNQRTESKLAQYGSSIDQATWSDGDHTREKSSGYQKDHHSDPNDKFVYRRDESQHYFNGEVHKNSTAVQAGGSPTSRPPQTTLSGGHESEKSSEHMDKIKNIKEMGDLLGVYGYAADKLNSSSEDAQGKTENTMSPARRLPDTKKLNPIMAITISRSRTKFFRYDNGIEYEEKEGVQVVTVEAPQGLFYSSALDQWSNRLQNSSKE